jgi:hypothetical protein
VEEPKSFSLCTAVLGEHPSTVTSNYEFLLTKSHIFPPTSVYVQSSLISCFSGCFLCSSSVSPVCSAFQPLPRPAIHRRTEAESRNAMFPKIMISPNVIIPIASPIPAWTATAIANQIGRVSFGQIRNG